MTEQGETAQNRRTTDQLQNLRAKELTEQLNLMNAEQTAKIILKLEDDLALALNRLRTVEMTDQLTGAVSRKGFEEALTGSIHLFEEREIPFSVLNLDLSKFKSEINDKLGHKKGDEALIEAVKIIREPLRRETDIVARRNEEGENEIPEEEKEDLGLEKDVSRMGGDEFLIILQGTKEEGARVVMERILENLRKNKDSLPPENIVQKINFNYGVLEWQKGMTHDGFMEEVDRRMYTQKRGAMDTSNIDNSEPTHE